MRVEFDEGEREGKHDENFIVLKIAAACLYPDGLHSIALILEAQSMAKMGDIISNVDFGYLMELLEGLTDNFKLHPFKLQMR